MLTSSFSLEAFEYLLQQLNVAAGLFQMRFERLLQFGIGRAMRDDERWSGAPLGVDVPRLPSGTQLFQLDRTTLRGQISTHIPPITARSLGQ